MDENEKKGGYPLDDGELDSVAGGIVPSRGTPYRCPACGSLDLKSVAWTKKHKCRDCGGVFTDDECYVGLSD